MRVSYLMPLFVLCLVCGCSDSDKSSTSTAQDVATTDGGTKDVETPTDSTESDASQTDGTEDAGAIEDTAKVQDTTKVDDSVPPKDTADEKDAGAPKDTGVAPDVTPTPDVAVEQDAGETPPKWQWTWANCHRAFNANKLSDEDKSKCQEHYKQAANKHRFGLRWYFLGHDENTVNTYPESQMKDLNDIYEPNQMDYFIHSRLRIVNPVAKEGSNGTTKFTIEELTPDIRQFLAIEETDPQKVLDIMIERLENIGVDGLVSKKKPGGLQPNAPEGDPLITLKTKWTSKQLHQTVARINEEHISIFVRDAAGEKSTANFPRKGIQKPQADIVYLASITPLSALPHELGHFFGLPHTHGMWSAVTGELQTWQTKALTGIGEEDWTALQKLAGADYSEKFQDTHLAYTSDKKTIDSFEDGHFLGRRVLAWADLTYTNDKTVASDKAFIELAKAGNPPYMKNFVRDKSDGATFWGNNCGKSYAGNDKKTLKCKYGDDKDKPAKVLTGKDELVKGSLLFADSTESNLMSYIATDTSDGVRRKIHLTTRQRDVIRLGTRAPSRLRLRNYMLFE